MKTPITSIKRLALALCLATPVVSWAAPNATAVWRSNLGQSYTIGGNTYAVKIYGAGTESSAGILNSDGTVTVTNEWTGWSSPCFEFGSDVTSISVLVKFSGFAAVTDDYGACLAAMRDSSGNEVGAYVAKGATHLSAFYKASAESGPTQVKLNGSDDAVVGNGYMLFSYSTSGGVKVYMGSSIDGLVGGAETNYRYSNKTISRLAIGGDADGAYYTPTGFTIEEVALFVGSSYTASDVADYVFPTVNVDTTSSMTMTELNTAVAAFGENTFNYYSASPVVTLDVEPSDATKTYIQSTLWNGTVFIKDVDKTDIYLTNYGNKNSTLKFSGVNGYIASAQFTNNATPVIELEDSITEGREYGLHLSNGYSFKDGYNNYKFTNTPELKGSGTLKTSGGGDGVLVVVDKWDNFTGKLDLSGKTIWFGTGVPELNNDSWVNLVNKPGTVRLGSTIPSNYSTWTVPNGYHGTVVQTTAANATETAFLTASAWKGTCKIAWNPGNSALDIVNYGNANSVIEIATNFGVYPTQNGGKDGAEVAGEVKIAENVTWTVSNGWTAESYRTTFAKLSGAGNLTVNGGSGGVGDPIPYTITRLEGFTGTIAGTRGKFTIGTIVAATEPTPGTKLVNITTSNAPVLDSTTVVYNNATQDVELEFKAGDGIYVKVIPNVASLGEGEDIVYYTSLTGENGAIAAATPLNRVITLLADVEEAYVLSSGRLKINLNGFTWTGLAAPEGYKIVTTPMSSYTQYTVEEDLPVVARIGTVEGQYEYATVEAALQAAIPMSVGTVVYVLVPVSEWKYSELDDTYKDYFNWNSGARTLTRKATTQGEGSETVTAADAEAACAAVTILPTSAEVKAAMGGASYETYFQKTAVETSEGSGVWTVTVELKKSQIFEGDASETKTATATLDGVLDDTADEVTIPAKRGLYYSFKSGDKVTGMTEGDRVLATGGTVTLDKVPGDTFYQVLVNTADKE